MNVTVRGCEKKKDTLDRNDHSGAQGGAYLLLLEEYYLFGFLHIVQTVRPSPADKRNRIENRPPVGNRNTPTEAITQCRDSIAARKRLRVIGGKAAALSCSSVTAFI